MFNLSYLITQYLVAYIPYLRMTYFSGNSSICQHFFKDAEVRFDQVSIQICLQDKIDSFYDVLRFV